jgi:hypothetical protein
MHPFLYGEVYPIFYVATYIYIRVTYKYVYKFLRIILTWHDLKLFGKDKLKLAFFK